MMAILYAISSWAVQLDVGDRERSAIESCGRWNNSERTTIDLDCPLKYEWCSLT